MVHLSQRKMVSGGSPEKRKHSLIRRNKTCCGNNEKAHQQYFDGERYFAFIGQFGKMDFIKVYK